MSLIKWKPLNNEIDTFDMKDVTVNDGQNHPLDKK